MKSYNDLRADEKEALLKFPAYISLLAANIDGKIDEEEKKSALKVSHIKTYSCDPLLADYFKEADLVFMKNIQQLDKELPKDRAQREEAIKHELGKLDKIVAKLGKDYAEVMHRSMSSFKNHVSKAHHNVLMDFILPLSVKGLTG